MVTALDEVRELWKAFDLSKSKNSGMRITENGKVTASYGVVHEVDGMDSFSAIPGLGFRPDGNDSSKPANRKRTAR